jgi:AbrB family looped-hinge helix DNA binding protein
MPAVKIGPKHQITIPKEVFDSLQLKVGDFVDTLIKDNAIVLVPQKLVPRDQEWFWTTEWQEKEREANEAIEKSAVSGPFTKASDLLKALKKE